MMKMKSGFAGLMVTVAFAVSAGRGAVAGDAYDAYLEAKATWTGKPDAAKLRKAFFKETFGAGQFNMAEFLSLLEKKGDARFSAAEVARLDWLVRDALGDVAGPGTACGKRIVEVRKRLLDPIAEKTDGIRDGVHDYCADNYKAPTDPAVVAALERFRDRKLALMLHFGIYAQLGIPESWPLVDAEAGWSRRLVDWSSGEAFKREYWSMARSFNPVRFQPEVWADIAARDGFRYVVFTTKHHDGFCMFDSKYSDFKVTSPDCPFSAHPKADVTRAVFDAFRAKGLSVSCYFSKPDWHHPDYWDNRGLGYRTDRMPSYDVEEDPARWARYRTFVRNQILELIGGYGPIDCLWLDGGQVQPKTGLDINIEEIVAAARKIQPGLIAVDRTVGNTCEDVITPEQKVPPQPLLVPWESCITMGTGFSYRYDDRFKSARELIHLLVDVVAKGGNLALNVAPGPDGRLPAPAVERMDAMGRWLKANGAAIYATRVRAPYRTGDWAFTQGKDNGPVYAIRLWKESEKGVRKLVLPAGCAEKVASVVHLASGLRAPAETRLDGTVSFELPDGAWADAVADAFRVE